jgi:hypothetical protein
MKLTKKHFIDGLNIDEVEMSDLRAFAEEHELSVETIFIRGRKKTKIANLLADWVESQLDAEDSIVDDTPKGTKQEATIEEEPAPQQFKKKEVPSEEKGSTGDHKEKTAPDGEATAHAPEPVGETPEAVGAERPVTPSQPVIPEMAKIPRPDPQTDPHAPMTQIREVPDEDRREDGRNEVPVANNEGGSDTGSNYMNRRQRQITASKGRFARQTEKANAEAEETTWHKRRAGKLRSHNKRR